MSARKNKNRKYLIIIGILFFIVILVVTFVYPRKVKMTGFDFIPYEVGESIHFIDDKGTSVSLTIEKGKMNKLTREIVLIKHNDKTRFMQYFITLSRDKITIQKIETLSTSGTLFTFPVVRIPFPLLKGKKYNKNNNGYSIIKGFESIHLNSGIVLKAIRIQTRSSGYYLKFFTSRAVDVWWAPGLGLIRLHHYEPGYEMGQLGEESPLWFSWEVVWEDVATPERLARYKEVIGSYPKESKIRD